jgi:hydroxyethylthiazole kinase
MEIAVRVAAGKPVPVVLDPVGYGAIAEKARVTAALAAAGRFAVIKGNQGEIMNMAGRDGRMRGVDSLSGEAEVADACREVARSYGCVAVATGERDFFSDGERVVRLENGDALLSRVSGTGCMVGMLVGAAVAVAPDQPLLAALAAVTLFTVAGETAARSELVRGPASFKIALLDAVAGTTPEAAAAGMRAAWL